MGDKFLGSGGSNINISNGTASIFGASIGAINLDPSQPLKTNSVRQLVSSKLDIDDINNLQNELNNAITDPITLKEKAQPANPAVNTKIIYASSADNEIHLLDEFGVDKIFSTSTTPFLPLGGGTMTGNLDMGNQQILNASIAGGLGLEVQNNKDNIIILQSDLGTETTNRTNADTNLQNQITTNDTDILNLQTDLGTETTNRTNADSNLQNQITTNDTDILNLQNGKVNKGGEPTGILSIGTQALNTSGIEISENGAPILQCGTTTGGDIEIRRTLKFTPFPSGTTQFYAFASDVAAGDSALQTQITNNLNQISTNIGDISTLQTDLGTETTNRTNADTNLQNQITSNDTDILNNFTELKNDYSSLTANMEPIDFTASQLVSGGITYNPTTNLISSLSNNLTKSIWTSTAIVSGLDTTNYILEFELSGASSSNTTVAFRSDVNNATKSLWMSDATTLSNFPTISGAQVRQQTNDSILYHQILDNGKILTTNNIKNRGRDIKYIRFVIVNGYVFCLAKDTDLSDWFNWNLDPAVNTGSLKLGSYPIDTSKSYYVGVFDSNTAGSAIGVIPRIYSVNNQVNFKMITDRNIKDYYKQDIASTQTTIYPVSNHIYEIKGSTDFTISNPKYIGQKISIFNNQNEEQYETLQGTDVGNGNVFKMISDGVGNIYLAGSFTSINGATINRFAKYNIDSGQYSACDGGIDDGQVNDMVLISNTLILIVGTFTSYNSGTVIGRGKGLLRYDPIADTLSEATDGPTNNVNVIIKDPVLKYAYIGGSFLTIDEGKNSLTVNKVAIYNYANDVFLALPNDVGVGITGNVQGLEISPDGRYLYLTGAISAAGNYTGLGNICRYDTATDIWSSLGTLNQQGNHLKLYGNYLYLASEALTQITQLDSTIKNINEFARYNTKNRQWAAVVENDLDGEVNVIEILPNGEVIVGGLMTNHFYHMSKFGKKLIGSGMIFSGQVYSLIYDDYSGYLYVGGNFTQSNNSLALNRIMKIPICPMIKYNQDVEERLILGDKIEVQARDLNYWI